MSNKLTYFPVLQVAREDVAMAQDKGDDMKHIRGLYKTLSDEQMLEVAEFMADRFNMDDYWDALGDAVTDVLGLEVA